MPTNYKTIINFRDGIQVDANDLVSNNGLVGIGTTIPREELDVRGSIIVENQANLRDINVVGQSTFYGNINVAVGNSVGIGTTIPEATFQVGVGTTGVTVDANTGKVTAVLFSGSGADLTDLPTAVWTNPYPGAGSTINAFRPVGISVTLPQADFAVGDIIKLDAISGIGTFEEVSLKKLNLIGNAQQGNIEMVGSISGIQSITGGTGNFETAGVGSFGALDIASGVVTGTSGGLTFKGDSKTIDFNQDFVNADKRVGVRFIETSTGSSIDDTVVAQILYNGGVTGTGGTESGQVEFWGDNGTDNVPRVIITREANVGIGTSRSRGFNLDVVGTGTVTGSMGAAGGFYGNLVGDIDGVATVAAGLTNSPDITVDDIDSLGINSIFIRNTGVSTFGGEVSVGNFLGVGATSSALGRGMGVIGGADFSGGGSFGGDLSVEGNLSIGGTFGGSVNITDVTAAEIIATGIISGTTSSSATLHDTTITGNVVQSAGKNLSVGQNLSIGGTTTFGSQINFGDATTQVSAAGTLFANLSGIITTGAITVGDLDVGGNFNYTGGSIATFGSILLNGVSGFVSCKSLDAGTGIISCTGLNARTGEITGGGLNLTGPTTSNNYFQSTAGVSTFFDIDITGGNNSNLKLTRLGFNTSLSTLGITEGIALWDNAEIFVDDSPGGGIGIGTTAGKRDSSVALYVGYGRDASGNFINGETVFEGGVGIGTMVGNNDGNMLEVYKETVFHSYHTGIGGTDAGPARVGFETNKPRTTLDLGFVTSGFLRIPSYFNDDPNNTVPNGSVQGTGCLFFDTASNTVAVKNSNDNWVGLSTVLNTGDDPAQYVQELGFIGGVTTQAERLTAEQGVANIIQPYDEVGSQGIGWGTAHMWYNKTFNKHQYKTNQGIGVATHYRSYVSTGTSAIDIELDSSGTKVYITLPGIGSATLNLV